MTRLLFLFLLAACTSLLAAQQEEKKPPTTEILKHFVETTPKERAKLAARIRESYYHPEKMSGLDCDLSINWPEFFSSLKANIPEDRRKTIQGLKIEARANRNQIPELTFNWADGQIDSKERFENGLKQMLDGFYQIY